MKRRHFIQHAADGEFPNEQHHTSESWVTDGEMLPKRGFKIDLVLGRIRWSIPNGQM